MKAVTYTQYGDPDVLTMSEVAKPVPADDEVLIRVVTTTVTSGDVNLRGFVFVSPSFKPLARLMFGIWKPKKIILGVELAGEIEAVGQNVTRFKVGDQVCGLDGGRLGAYAEYTCRPATGSLVHKPANLSFEEAAALPNGALTAYTFLKKMADIQSGQKVLINGASGSVGSAAVQLAKYYGAEVTGVCSGRNAEMVLSLGADKVIDYTQEDFTQNSEDYDIIFDAVGKISFGSCKASLSADGIYIIGSGGLGDLIMAPIVSMLGRKKMMSGVSSESLDDLEVIHQIAEAGAFKPVIDRCYPLEQIVDAHRYVDTGRKKGNVVINVQP